MARKRAAEAPDPQPEQLVFPFRLRVGDVVLEDEERFEVVGRPTNAANAKPTRAWLRREGETVQREAIWEEWREVWGEAYSLADNARGAWEVNVYDLQL